MKLHDLYVSMRQYPMYFIQGCFISQKRLLIPLIIGGGMILIVEGEGAMISTQSKHAKFLSTSTIVILKENANVIV